MIDKIKTLTALIGLLSALSGWLGFATWQAQGQAEATRQQMTTVVNHIYHECE